MFRLPRTAILRWICAAWGGVSAAGLVPVYTSTAPSGAWRASHAPSTPLAIPVTMATPSSEREAWERLKDLALGADPQGVHGIGFLH
jgi:hypothetical protein